MARGKYFFMASSNCIYCKVNKKYVRKKIFFSKLLRKVQQFLVCYENSIPLKIENFQKRVAKPGMMLYSENYQNS